MKQNTEPVSAIEAMVAGLQRKLAELAVLQANEQLRPFRMNHALIIQEENCWCCCNQFPIERGVIAYGITPKEAAAEYDRIWEGK